VAAIWLLTLRASAQTPAAAAQAAFDDDVHAAVGLTCSACHPGQPATYATARTDIAPLCARCHADAAYMRQFDPQVRVDQFAQYVTSVHGQQMAKGETRVATCSDCHSPHGIRRIRDARSSVAPLQVATTCARCHADAELMASFGRQPTPMADWSASVHATALIRRGDTSAPTCSTCHGSHGAVPPGVTDVANVCSQCHVREAELFRASAKKTIFDAIGQPECLVCHSNHRIEHPEDDWIGLTEGAVCAVCHDSSTGGSDTVVGFRDQFDSLSGAIGSADQVLTRAERAGMLVYDGRAALQEASEHLIDSRVLLHTFSAAPVAEVTSSGLAAARRAEASGVDAMRELGYRRTGLGIATLLIVGFLITLGIKIRSLPSGH
jgi:hypothetical protein